MLDAQRRVALMALIAHSLHHHVPGQLVFASLRRTLSPELPQSGLMQLLVLPAALRAAMLVLLAQREGDADVSPQLWRRVHKLQVTSGKLRVTGVTRTSN